MRPLAIALVMVVAARLAHAKPKPTAVLWFKDDRPKLAEYGARRTNEFGAFLAKRMGWGSVKATIHTVREAAEKYIGEAKPKFGFIALPAFLAWQAKYKLTALATMKDTIVGDEMVYRFISNQKKDVDGCKLQLVSSHEFVDPVFVDKVVAKGVFATKDFTVLADETDGLEVIRKLLKKKVACSFIDGVDFSGLRGIADGDTLKEIWRSEPMPYLVVVAFPTATAAERKAFTAKLPKLCDGDAGKKGCELVGGVSFSTDTKALEPLIKAYSE